MKSIKHVLAFLLCFVMLVAMFPVAAFAANGATNLSMTVNATTVEVGDTFTVVLKSKAMDVTSFACGIQFDTALLEVTKINSPTLRYDVFDEEEGEDVEMRLEPTAIATVEEANENGTVGAAWANATERSYKARTTLINVTFKAIASGEAEISFFEDSAGTDGYKNENVDSAIVNIKGSEPEHECTPGDVSYKKGENGKHIKVVACAENCGEIYSSTEESCSGGTADCENAAVCEFCGNAYGAAKGHGNEGFRYTHVAGTDTHDRICVECEKTVEEKVACTFEEGSHVCKYACGNETDCSDAAGDKDHDCDVCGKPGITQCSGGTATCKDKAVCSECGKEYGKIDAENHVGDRKVKYIDNGDEHIVKVYYFECEHEISSTNEPHNYGEDFICDNCGHKLAGWVEMDGNWYYVVDGKAVTGATRVPYPTVAINGVTYAANAEDKAYAESHAGSMYTDAETAVFVFDENGVFQSDFTGIIGNRYAVNGVIAWHVGLVEINGEYYYFGGDENGGGNIMVTGKVYASRNTTGFEIVAGGIYYFGEDGKMCQYEGIVEIDGEKFYFEDNRLMIGAGLTELDGQYIYVRSNGQLATGKYWVAKTNGICSVGMYTFDENGFMQTAKDPGVNGLVDGIYYKDGMPYYAGLIEIDGATYYINSAGEAVTGAYYVTKLDNYTGDLDVKPGDKLTFAADGKLVTE